MSKTRSKLMKINQKNLSSSNDCETGFMRENSIVSDICFAYRNCACLQRCAWKLFPGRGGGGKIQPLSLGACLLAYYFSEPPNMEKKYKIVLNEILRTPMVTCMFSLTRLFKTMTLKGEHKKVDVIPWGCPILPQYYLGIVRQNIINGEGSTYLLPAIANY